MVKKLREILIAGAIGSSIALPFVDLPLSEIKANFVELTERAFKLNEFSPKFSRSISDWISPSSTLSRSSPYTAAVFYRHHRVDRKNSMSSEESTTTTTTTTTTDSSGSIGFDIVVTVDDYYVKEILRIDDSLKCLYNASLLVFANNLPPRDNTEKLIDEIRKVDKNAAYDTICVAALHVRLLQEIDDELKCSLSRLSNRDFIVETIANIALTEIKNSKLSYFANSFYEMYTSESDMWTSPMSANDFVWLYFGARNDYFYDPIVIYFIVIWCVTRCRNNILDVCEIGGNVEIICKLYAEISAMINFDSFIDSIRKLKKSSLTLYNFDETPLNDLISQKIFE